MYSRYRMQFYLSLCVLVGLTINNSVSAQGEGKFRVFSGGSNNNSNNNNSDNNQGGNRRNRNRDDDEDNNSGFFGGSDAQKIQQAIQGIQGNSGQQQQFRGGKQGLQFKNNQPLQRNNQWQGFPGNNPGDGQNRRAQRRHNMQSWALQFGGATPFSVEWYKDHPQAWHHNHHHDDDAWKIATAAGVLTWLGWGGQPYVPGPTVVYEPLPVETIYVEGQPVVVDPNAPGEWMSLGVFSLVTSGGDDGTRLLQLAVDKHGHVRGSYYDTISNTSHNLTGRIHQPTQQVQWTLDTNQQMVFYTPLSQLTQSQGVVWAKFPSGQQQQWQLARMDNVGN
jgi:hypothetical protein